MSTKSKISRVQNWNELIFKSFQNLLPNSDETPAEGWALPGGPLGLPSTSSSVMFTNDGGSLHRGKFKQETHLLKKVIKLQKFGHLENDLGVKLLLDGAAAVEGGIQYYDY